MSYKVCLTATGQPRVIVEIGPDDTLEDLYTIASERFGRTCELKRGFPPKLLERSFESKAQSVVTNNDRVTVIFLDERKKGPKRKVDSKSETTTTSSQEVLDIAKTAGRRSQRAAAKAATESFAEVIKEQDKMMQEAPKRKRQATTIADSSRSPKQIASATASRKLAKLPGRRLCDGLTVGPTASRKAASKKSSKSSAKFNNKDDVSFALINALDGGGGGKVGQVLRGAMRNAITRQYDASRAVTRVSAVQAGKYSFTTTGSSLVVVFDKGLEGRGKVEETVDYIPREALEAVITAIHASDEESLRPLTLSQLSPRVFWSLMKETNNPSSVEDALRQILPDLNWTFLRRRKQTLSEKAKENIRQERMANGTEDEVNLDLAAEAVQAVEDAMEQVQQFDQARRRGRAAEAALTRQVDNWRLVTPAEEDEDELKECCNEDRHVRKLLEIGIHNWRELANANAETIARLLGTVDVEIVEQWIDRAQQESVEEIIVEVCDDRVDVVQVLGEEARSGTPKDLANWRSMPDLLLQSASSLEGVSVEELSKWCQRAYALLQEYEWLSWYATPVD